MTTLIQPHLIVFGNILQLSKLSPRAHSHPQLLDTQAVRCLKQLSSHTNFLIVPILLLTSPLLPVTFAGLKRSKALGQRWAALTSVFSVHSQDVKHLVYTPWQKPLFCWQENTHKGLLFKMWLHLLCNLIKLTQADGLFDVFPQLLSRQEFGSSFTLQKGEPEIALKIIFAAVATSWGRL